MVYSKLPDKSAQLRDTVNRFVEKVAEPRAYRIIDGISEMQRLMLAVPCGAAGATRQWRQEARRNA